MEAKTGIQKWFEVDGDNTLALDWPLTEDSHVWEIGGFEGRWAEQIWNKFHCHITIFEPQLWAVENMKIRFAGITKIDIRPYGLSLNDEMLQIGNYHTDGASLVKNDGREPTMPGFFKGFYHEIYDFPHDIDLALMNIEGYEYTLIPAFISSGMMGRFSDFWCQFHPAGEDDHKKFIDITVEISETHNLLWNCYPTAVAWRRR